MIRTRGLTHLALRVRDAERAFAFYEQVFGMVAVFRGPGFVQAQTPGAWDVIVFEEPYETGQIVSRGEFVPGEPYLFCRDPDGHDLEIWYELPTSADPAHSRRSPDD